MWSDFHFTDDRQYGDNNLPVVPEHFYRAELIWTSDFGFWLAPSVEWSMSDAWVDYANTFKSPSYTVVNFGLGQEFDNGVSLFVDVRNVFDETYVSNFTPVVNWTTSTPAQQMVFFPGDPRSVYAGIAMSF
jgi:iron complex outermembrane receptor protein